MELITGVGMSKKVIAQKTLADEIEKKRSKENRLKENGYSMFWGFLKQASISG
jgi:hypothetical protein